MAAVRIRALDTERLTCPRCRAENRVTDSVCASCAFPLLAAAAKRLPAASPSPRLAAAAIDLGIVLALSFLASLGLDAVVRSLNGDEAYILTGTGHAVAFGFVSGVIALAYYVPFTSGFGGTPGKLLFGLQVVDLQTGSRMTISQAAWRTLFFLVFAASPLFLGLLEGLARILNGDRWIEMVQYLPLVLIVLAFAIGNLYSALAGDHRRPWHYLPLWAVAFIPFLVTLFVRGYDRESFFLDEQVLPILLLALPILTPIVCFMSPGNDRRQTLHDSLITSIVTRARETS